jgi:hypothetical protein
MVCTWRIAPIRLKRYLKCLKRMEANLDLHEADAELCGQGLGGNAGVAD